uniref:Uncharacterized mitochondrial protein AtMg00810-like n=1 Tax=Tanacetum cinerariifolium TaxID=118510 RepID=A0A6L2KD84_TANCI|nr:uncharacterized mitochondrial protein AtMg00810-like [Tanacetum cinerariifolium]
MCDKKSKVLFTDTECLVLSPDFKLPDENQELLRVPRQNNMCSFNLENIFPFGGIKREYSNARTPKQIGVAERKNKTLIEAARTMLATSFLPNTFWPEAVSTACYVLNRVLVTKPQNKTPFELLTGKIPIISYIRPFGCHVTILNTIDHHGKFEEKSDEEFLDGYSVNNKAFMVYNLKTKMVEENLHIFFLENKPNVAGKGPTWLFDLDYLTDSINYQPVTTENKANKTAGLKEANNSVGTQDNIDTKNSELEAEHAQEYFVLPLWSSYTSNVKSSETKNGDEKLIGDTANEADDAAKSLRKTFAKNTKDLLLQAGAARATNTNYVNTASTTVNTASTTVNTASTPVNTASTPVNTASTLVHTGSRSRNVSVVRPSYPKDTYATQDDSRIPSLEDIYEVLNDEIFTSASYDDEGAVADFINLESTMNIEPKKISQALEDESWVDAMQEELLQFKTQQQAPRAWYATLSTFLVQSGYRRGLIDKTMFIKKDKKDIMHIQVYVDDIIFGSTKKSCFDEFVALTKSMSQMSFMAKLTFFLGLQVKQREDGIFISQDKYVAEILKKFDFISVKTASTLIETKKPLVKDAEAADVDVHLYRSMIGSLMYLTASRPYIMFLKGQPNLGIWYPKESTFDLEAYSDSDYARANLDRKSTIGGCQFLCRRLISWQCKKQTIIATSTTEAEGKAKTRLNIEEGNFNKLDNLVGESADYAINRGRSTDKIKVLNAKAEGVSAAGKTLSNATLAGSTASVQLVLLCCFEYQEAKMGMRKFFKCWFHYHIINGHKLTMSNRHQELVSPKANEFCKELTSPKQMDFGKDFSNPLMADSLPKTIWLSMHHVIAMKHWLFQSKRLLCYCLKLLLVKKKEEDNTK